MIVLLFLVSSGSAAQASNGAGIARDFNCYMGDASGNIVLATDSQATNTKNGTTLVCQTTVLNPTGQAIVTSGFPCSSGGVITTDTHETISANGNATMTCHSHF
jgi:hypothetical protein